MWIVRRFRPTPAMVVALIALVAAVGGIAAARPGHGGIGANGVVRVCRAETRLVVSGVVTAPGALRVIGAGESCRSGEQSLLLRAAGDRVTEDVPIAFAARTVKGRPVANRWAPITANALAKGSYMVQGAIRIHHRNRVATAVRIRCGLRGPKGRFVPGSVVAATFEQGDAGDLALPVSATIDRMPAGRLTLACEQISLGGRRATGASGRAAADSPVLLSGNMVQVPIRIPIHICGNTVNPIGPMNPAFGNTCTNSG
jgi:hypothetical protein